MQNFPPKKQSSIPENLRRQLEDFRKHLWRRKVVEAVGAGLIGLLVSFLLIFALDRVWETPGFVRLVILLGGVFLFAGFAPYWIHRWVWGHRQEGQLARLISKKFPGLGDRLLGVIELQNEGDKDENVSARLRSAAMEVVAKESEKRNLVDALPAPRHLKWAIGAAMLLFVAVATFVIAPAAGRNALERWIKPFSKVERYTFTQLENPVDHLAVPYGEAFEITLKIATDSENRPEVAFGQYAEQSPVKARLAGNEYRFSFSGQQEAATITFKIGDLRHLVKVQPMHRPYVERAKVLVKPPGYLGIPEKEIDLLTGEFSAVEGSEFSVELTMSRALESGEFGPTEVSGEMGQAQKFSPSEGELGNGDLVSTGPIKVGDVAFTIPFEWTDSMGLKGGEDYQLRVDAVKDLAPSAYVQGLDRQIAILPEEVLDFEILGEDDFGLRKVGIQWESAGTRPGEESVESGELIISKGGPEELRLLGEVSFSPSAFEIGPQRLVLRSFSEDFFPSRERSFSQPILVYVLSREEHLQLLKSRFDRTLSEMEDLARKELNLLDENRRLERLDGEELQKEENLRRIEDQERAENENIERMKKMREQMEELLKGATRNGDVDKETLKKMANTLKFLQELEKTDLPEVSEKLRDAKEQSNTPEKSKQDMAEAVEEQQEAVDKLQRAIAQANDGNESFEASTFIARLKKAASDQRSVVSNLVSLFERDVLGRREGEIDPADDRKLGETEQKQSANASSIRWIQEDLGHYHARTQNETFKAVRDEMKKAKVDLGLEQLRTKIQDNHSFEAAQESKRWAEKLAEWAQTLAGDQSSGGQGGGGAGSAGGGEDEDFEFMLRVMKMIQTQQDLRARTRVLEQLKRDSSASPDTAE